MGCGWPVFMGSVPEGAQNKIDPLQFPMANMLLCGTLLQGLLYLGLERRSFRMANM